MPFGKVKLNDGNEIPAIAFGTGSALRGSDVTSCILQALNVGFCHLDTAQRYGSESSVGEAIKESRLPHSELFVTTKYNWGPIRQTLEESLEKLGRPYVDLYMPHFADIVSIHEWKEFEKIKQDRLASIGVSNYNLQQLQALVKHAKIKPSVNQIALHPYNYRENKALLEYAARNDIIISAYSCLTPITQFPGGPVDAPVAAAATRRGVAPAQILLAWVRAKGAVIVAISTKAERLREFLDAGDIRPLTDDEIRAIDVAGARGPPT
ncbi:NADP-dependent oxidoreductase domain-containing protein [Crepidotus variabilis]|uniref:NADP-dependent oxidoreductase domain-containing protein n=1 Tax=Crepidotus variabilis TaxID=179855 RepID=A0A9P6EAU3_9AGAR|nr:NADP-dependent oxidoreductase domain-containing protein [Crepidotus variabilis]